MTDLNGKGRVKCWYESMWHPSSFACLLSTIYWCLGIMFQYIFQELADLM